MWEFQGKLKRIYIGRAVWNIFHTVSFYAFKKIKKTIQKMIAAEVWLIILQLCLSI